MPGGLLVARGNDVLGVRGHPPGGSKGAQITAENRLTTYRTARSALSALEPHLLPSPRNSGEIASNCGNFPTLRATVQVSGPEPHLFGPSGEGEIPSKSRCERMRALTEPVSDGMRGRDPGMERGRRARTPQVEPKVDGPCLEVSAPVP